MPKTAKYKDLPVYRIAVDDDVEGMTKVSLVDLPAVEVDFISLKKAEPARQLYAVQDEERRLVRGVLLRADYPIYRKNIKFGEFYIVFEKETIRELAEQYLTDGRANAVNQMHAQDSDVTGVNLVQWFIKDSAAGVNPAGFDEVEEGSLFAEYHVENDDVWEKIKDGTFKGFSIECTTYYEPVAEGEETFEGAGLLALINKYKNMPNLIEKLKAAFNQIVGDHFRTDTTDKGVIAWEGEEDIKVGDTVEIVSEDDERSAAPDDTYTLSDGTVVTIEGGAVTEVKEPESEPAEDNTGDDKEGEGTEARTQDPAAGEGSPAEHPRRSLLAKIKSIFESESYTEKVEKIAAAIAAAGYTDGYIYEAGDDYAIYVYWNEETDWKDRYLKFPVSWNENGDPELGDAIQVKHAFVPVEEQGGATEPAESETVAQLRADVDEVVNIVTCLISVVKEHSDSLSKVSAAPAGVPAFEAFKRAQEKANKDSKSDISERLRKYLK